MLTNGTVPVWAKRAMAEKALLFRPALLSPRDVQRREGELFTTRVAETEVMFWHRTDKGKTCIAERATMFPPSSDEPMAIDGHRANKGKTCKAETALKSQQTTLKSEKIDWSQYESDHVYDAHVDAFEAILIHYDETEPRSWFIKGDNWDIKAPLSANARHELSYWLTNMVNLNGRTLHTLNLIDAVCFSMLVQ